MKFLQNTTNLDLNRKFDVLKGLSFAVGGEFRLEQFGLRAGRRLLAQLRHRFRRSLRRAGFAGFLPSNEGDNSRSSIGAYIDAEQDFTRNWMVGAALRFENYSDFGSTINYKIASRYKIGDHLSLRASASSSFRAPSMQQRFYAKTNTLFVSIDGQLTPVESGTFTNDSRPAVLGIPELTQETSQSFTAGVTARPTEGLEISVDAYQIDIDDRIVLTNNFTDGGNAELKAQLEAAGAGQANFFANAIDTRSRGVEAVIAYGKVFGGKHDLRFTLAATYIDNEVKKNPDGTPRIQASPILIKRAGRLAILTAKTKAASRWPTPAISLILP